MHVSEYFDRGVQIARDKPCFTFAGQDWTYAQAQEENMRIAQALRANEVGQGTHCAVLSDNHPTAFNCVLGLCRAGGVWIPVNAKNAVQAHCDFLALLECEVLFFSKAYEGMIERLRQAVPTIRLLVCIDGESAFGPSLAAFIADAKAEPFPLIYDPQAPAVMPSTGGTTGSPKGVVISYRAWQTFMANMMSTLRFDRHSVYLAAAPMTHAAGAYAFPVMATGGRILFHDGVNPQLFMSDIQKYGVTETFLPPSATLAVLAQPNVREFDYSTLRHFISSASPIAPDRVREAIDVFGPCWTQLYGQVEVPAIMTVLQPEDCYDDTGVLLPDRLASVGRAAPFMRLGIMNEAGELLPPGEKGEIVVQSDQVMSGYYKNPDATAEVSLYGWHHTGNVGKLDDEGFLVILDRTKDMIITGGMNVYPSEIENYLSKHDAVHEVAVIGVPDDKWGEAVKAIVKLKQGAAATEAELIVYCKAELGSVKAPKSVDFVSDFPKSAVGKLLKKDMRAAYWRGAGRQI
jgi:acyl-CoA synthetase (AMP-forming)/AMP-acid ligase II